MFDTVAEDKNSRARVGRITIGETHVETPSYVVVATNGYIRTLEPEDIPPTRTQMVISNTYHLWRELGDEGLATYSGLHEVMEWKDGLIMTDSGGFQVFSLGVAREHATGKISKETGSDFKSGENLVRVTDSGVYFKDDSFLRHGSGSEVGRSGEEEYLDAELSIKIQEQLGADIVLAFDEPSSPSHDHAYTRVAMERTHAWATRSLEAKESEQKIYGIVQGGAFEDLRTMSAKAIGAMPFDGFAIGGAFSNSFGDTRERTAKELEWTIPHLPAFKPRHLLGIGRIEDLFVGVENGIDTFDCVIPTREARHGSLWTSAGRLDIGGKGKYADDGDLIAPDCDCPVCGEKQLERRELHKMFRDKNPDAGRLATIHNIYFFNDLMRQIRESIQAGEFADLKKKFLEPKK